MTTAAARSGGSRVVARRRPPPRVSRRGRADRSLSRWGGPASAGPSARATAPRPPAYSASSTSLPAGRGCPSATATSPPRRSAPSSAGATTPPTGATTGPCAFPIPASHERMWRDDHLYDVVVVLDYNLARPAAGPWQRHLPPYRRARLRADRRLHRAGALRHALHPRTRRARHVHRRRIGPPPAYGWLTGTSPSPGSPIRRTCSSRPKNQSAITSLSLRPSIAENSKRAERSAVCVMLSVAK